jgi:hypothetical protein
MRRGKHFHCESTDRTVYSDPSSEYTVDIDLATRAGCVQDRGHKRTACGSAREHDQVSQGRGAVQKACQQHQVIETCTEQTACGMR